MRPLKCYLKFAESVVLGVYLHTHRFSCHSLGVPLPFVPCLSMSLLGSSFHFMHLEWDDASCDVVANRGRCRRWSPPRGYDFSKMCLLACVYARAHQRFCTFLLSQPSHASAFLLPLVDGNEGVTTKNVGDFLKNLPRFSDYLPRFFLLLRLSSKSLLLSRKTLAVFLAFCPLFFCIFSPCSTKFQKNVYKVGVITFVSAACMTICEGCESKKCYFAGCARVRARERP